MAPLAGFEPATCGLTVRRATAAPQGNVGEALWRRVRSCFAMLSNPTLKRAWRRVWDSNPRNLSVRRFSRPLPSTARPTLRHCRVWWAQMDLNQRPLDYRSSALPTELCAHSCDSSRSLRSQDEWRARRDSNPRSPA